MSAPAITQADTITAELTEAAKHLRYTRRRWAHSPNADTSKATEQAEAHVRDLLDRLWAAMTPTQQAEADRRAVRRKVAGQVDSP